jgi:hypothetical protein
MPLNAWEDLMNTQPHKKRYWLVRLLFLGIVAAVVMLQLSHVNVSPPPPTGITAPYSVAATTSHLSLVVAFPNAAIAAQLESGVPKSYQIDVNSDGVRAYGTLSRGVITVVNDVAAKKVSASTSVGGRVQVEKKILLVNASVGIDVSGTISASLAPEIAPNWMINPRFDLSAQVNRAVAKTALGDIDVTGHVQGPVRNALTGVKGAAEAKVKEVLDVRKHVERLWNEMNSVHKLADNPPTWLRITPRQAMFGQFHYTKDSIDSGLALDLETHVFLQDAPPELLKSPLSDLRITGTLSSEFELSIPVEVSYSVINQQLKAALTKNPVDLSQNASVAITDATMTPHGDGILLTIDFSGKKGWFKSASGRLYIVGAPIFDVGKSELCVDRLEFTAETKSLLVKTVDWLAHATLLERMKSAAVVKLDSELAKAKTTANEELDKLKSKLPKEVGANVSVTELSIDRLAHAQDRAFAVVKAKGKMSAQLRP